MRIFSIGHGTRSSDELLALLAEHGIATLADVRTHPGSRRHPQFGRAALSAALSERGLTYVHLPGLGGRRRPAPDSPHAALRVEAFRGYADHMATEEFARDLARLAQLAREATTAFLCAETLWWRCHRRMLADALAARGWEVTHLLGPGTSEPHRLWDIARVEDDRLVYDGGTLALPT